MTVSQAQAILSIYVGAGLTFIDRLNRVRFNLLQLGNWPDTMRLLEIAVTTDATGYPVVVLPAGYSTILAGSIKPPNTTNPWCGGLPLGTRNIFDWFNKNGFGYGSGTWNFQELTPDGSGTKRYRVPTCTDDSYTYVVIAKIDYVALTAGSDTVTPNNIEALAAGLQALNAQDADDRGRSRELWKEAEALLATQAENLIGAGAEGAIEIADDLCLAAIGIGL